MLEISNCQHLQEQKVDPHAGMDGQCVRVHDSRLLSIERFPQILNLLFMKSQFKDDITVWPL